MIEALSHIGKTLFDKYISYQLGIFTFAVGMIVGEAWTLVLLNSPRLLGVVARLL